MKDQTQNLAPCPFCARPAFESAGLVGCDNRFCIMRHAPLSEKYEWENRPDLRRIKELEDALREIAAFGTVNTGCGFTCANMARDVLAGTTTHTHPTT